MRNMRIIAIILAAMMFVTLFGCGEAEQSVSSNNTLQSDAAGTVSQSIASDVASQTDNVNKDTQTTPVQYASGHPVATSFKAMSGDQVLTMSVANQETYDWNDFDETVQIEQEIKKLTKLTGHKKKYTINGTEYTFVYDISIVHPGGETVDRYRNGQMSIQYCSNKFTGFDASYDKAFEYKQKAENAKQREELARQAVWDFLSYDTTGFAYSEANIGSTTICGYLNAFVGEKKVDKKFIVRFNEKGELYACLLQGGGNMNDCKEYPDFDYNECFKVAQERFFKNAESYKKAVKYANATEYNRYTKIGDKYYYIYRFYVAFTAEGTEHEFVNTSDLGFFVANSVDIYVELITE